MSNFTPQVEKTYEMEGDEIRVRFTRLKRKHILEFLPQISKMTMTGAEDISGEQMAVVGELVGVLPEYVTEFAGLKDKDGNALEFTDVCEEVYFLELMTEIATDLITESMPTFGDQSKN